MQRITLFVHAPLLPGLESCLNEVAAGDQFLVKIQVLSKTTFQELFRSRPCVLLIPIDENETPAVIRLLKEIKNDRIKSGGDSSDPSFRIVVMSKKNDILPVHWASLGVHELMMGVPSPEVFSFKLERHYQKAIAPVTRLKTLIEPDQSKPKVFAYFRHREWNSPPRSSNHLAGLNSKIAREVTGPQTIISLTKEKNENVLSAGTSALKWEWKEPEPLHIDSVSIAKSAEAHPDESNAFDSTANTWVLTPVDLTKKDQGASRSQIAGHPVTKSTVVSKTQTEKNQKPRQKVQNLTQDSHLKGVDREGNQAWSEVHAATLARAEQKDETTKAASLRAMTVVENQLITNESLKSATIQTKNSLSLSNRSNEAKKTDSSAEKTTNAMANQLPKNLESIVQKKVLNEQSSEPRNLTELKSKNLDKIRTESLVVVESNPSMKGHDGEATIAVPKEGARLNSGPPSLSQKKPSYMQAIDHAQTSQNHRAVLLSNSISDAKENVSEHPHDAHSELPQKHKEEALPSTKHRHSQIQLHEKSHTKKGGVSSANLTSPDLHYASKSNESEKTIALHSSEKSVDRPINDLRKTENLIDFDRMKLSKNESENAWSVIYDDDEVTGGAQREAKTNERNLRADSIGKTSLLRR